MPVLLIAAAAERGPGHTGDGYDAMHPGSRVLGRYQIAPKAFRDIGWQDQYGNWTAKAKAHGVASEADFLERPDAQEAALGEYFKRNDEQLQANGSRAHLGEKYVSPIGIGFTVTEAGLAAAAHRAGAKYTTQALEKLESKRNGNPQRFRARCFSAESGFPFSANSDSRLGLGLGDQSR